MRLIDIAFHNKGAAILLPALKKLRVSTTQAPVVTLAKEVRNALAFYKKPGSGEPWNVYVHNFQTS